MRRKLIICLMVVLAVLLTAACGGNPGPGETPKTEEPKPLVLATTTSTKDSGLLDKLLPVFEEKKGYKVKVISQGTGQAIKTGEMGDCDVILVHARAAEDKFVADGYGVDRRDVMYNDFIVVGPEPDPAQIKGKTVEGAYAKLAQSAKYEFISRGDDSGTHKMELQLWDKAGVKPQGKWYLSVGKGMGDTLIMTSEKQAYTMTDRGTYASMKDKLKLEIIVEGDKLLLNPYGVIAINPQKHPDINYEGASAFIEFITSQEGKDIINNYKVNGQQLFYAK